MKLLIASCFYPLAEKIEFVLHAAGIPADIDEAGSIDTVLKALAEDRYDGLISEYALSDIDIWKLAALVHSERFVPYPIPLLLIQETCETAIPLLLSNEYRFKVTAINELATLLQAPPSPEDFKPTLLIIEDDAAAADIAYNALKACYRIEVARDGLAGLAQWQQQRHDLILLDLMLPKLSGDDVLSKTLAIKPDQPIIIVTAFADNENHKNLVLNGASEFLGKPHTLTELRRICRIVHHRAKLISEIHYREDKFRLLGNHLWLLQHTLHQQDLAGSQRALQKIQTLLPFNTPGDDEQLSLLKSVS